MRIVWSQITFLLFIAKFSNHHKVMSQWLVIMFSFRHIFNYFYFNGNALLKSPFHRVDQTSDCSESNLPNFHKSFFNLNPLLSWHHSQFFWWPIAIFSSKWEPVFISLSKFRWMPTLWLNLNTSFIFEQTQHYIYLTNK